MILMDRKTAARARKCDFIALQIADVDFSTFNDGCNQDQESQESNRIELKVYKSDVPWWRFWCEIRTTNACSRTRQSRAAAARAMSLSKLGWYLKYGKRNEHYTG
jgi:hypothetical protein